MSGSDDRCVGARRRPLDVPRDAADRDAVRGRPGSAPREPTGAGQLQLPCRREPDFLVYGVYAGRIAADHSDGREQPGDGQRSARLLQVLAPDVLSGDARGGELAGVPRAVPVLFRAPQHHPADGDDRPLPRNGAAWRDLRERTPRREPRRRKRPRELPGDGHDSRAASRGKARSTSAVDCERGVDAGALFT
eukprot:2825311-Rhodomonas_salina.1